MSKLFTFIRENPVILPVYLPSLFYGFSRAMLIPIMPLYVGSFEVTYGVIGIVLAGEAIGTLLGDVPAGILLRHLDQKFVVLLGILMAALSTVALFWVQSVTLVFALQILAGMGTAMFNVAQHTYLTQHVHLVSRGRAISFYGGIVRIASLAGPVLSGIIAESAGLRVPFLWFGASCAIALLSVVVLMKRTPDESPFENLPVHGNLLLTLKQNARILFSAGAAQLFAQMIRAGRRVLIPLFAADILGLDVQQIGFIIGFSSAVDMALVPAAGWLMDRFGRKWAIVPCFGIQAVAMLLVPLTSDFFGLLLAASLMGFGNGIGSGTMMTLGADLAPPESRGEFLGVWRLIGDTGFTGAPLIVGTVADLVTLPMAAVAMAIAGFTASSIFALTVPETLKKKPKVQAVSPTTAP